MLLLSSSLLHCSWLVLICCRSGGPIVHAIVGRNTWSASGSQLMPRGKSWLVVCWVVLVMVLVLWCLLFFVLLNCSLLLLLPWCGGGAISLVAASSSSCSVGDGKLLTRMKNTSTANKMGGTDIRVCTNSETDRIRTRLRRVHIQICRVNSTGVGTFATKRRRATVQRPQYRG